MVRQNVQRGGLLLEEIHGLLVHVVLVELLHRHQRASPSGQVDRAELARAQLLENLEFVEHDLAELHRGLGLLDAELLLLGDAAGRAAHR